LSREEALLLFSVRHYFAKQWREEEILSEEKRVSSETL
jgi:hypothetical protein